MTDYSPWGCKESYTTKHTCKLENNSIYSNIKMDKVFKNI